jgi:hypothetical protein
MEITVSDYYLYVLDNIAKGALIDFFQSYDLNIWRCPPQKRHMAVGTINFGIRSFSTYIVIWSALSMWSKIKSKSKLTAQ